MADISTIMESKKTEPIQSSEHLTKSRIFWRNARRYFREYSEVTGIHGLRYVAEERTITEKVIWIITLILAFSGCTYMIMEIYQKWDNSPVIVVFATAETPIFRIPFPAVTICPETKARKDFFDYTATNNKYRFKEENLTETEITHLNYMNMLCDVTPDGHKYLADFPLLKNVTDDFYDFMLNSTNISSLFHECNWMGYAHKCSALFMPIVTDAGLCFTFNMLNKDDIFRKSVVTHKNLFQSNYTTNWTIQDGYPSITNRTRRQFLNQFPRRALLAGARNSLSVILKSSKRDIDYMCNDNPKGYKVSLHASIRYPWVSQQYFRVPLDTDVVSAIKPDVITTSEAVRKYDVKKRKCFYDNERKLSLFKIYTQASCQIECFNNLTIGVRYTNCSHFAVPRNNKTKICPPVKYNLLEMTEFFYQRNDVLSQLSDGKADYYRLSKKIPNDCNCLPMCTDLSYNVEISQSQWDWRESFEAVDNVTFEKDVSLSKLTLYFKESHFVASERHELYGPSDFLSNFGGLLGLFTGFSLISVIEVLYFLTLRILSNIRLYGNWAG